MTGAASVRVTATGTALAMSMTLGSCGSDASGSGTGAASSGPTSPSSPTRGATHVDRTDGRGAARSTNEELVQIGITIGDQRFTATLDDSAAAQDLLRQLPVAVDMVDHGGVEKTGPLPESLSLDGQPEGADPSIGDVGYYAPGNDLVLYYGDQSYFPGIVVLGRLDGDAVGRIAALGDAVTASVEAA